MQQEETTFLAILVDTIQRFLIILELELVLAKALLMNHLQEVWPLI